MGGGEAGCKDLETRLRINCVVCCVCSVLYVCVVCLLLCAGVLVCAVCCVVCCVRLCVFTVRPPINGCQADASYETSSEREPIIQ